MAYAVKMEYVRNWRGKIMGRIYYLDNGDKEATDSLGHGVGWYRAATDITTDFNGGMVGRGDIVLSLIPIDRS